LSKASARNIPSSTSNPGGAPKAISRKKTLAELRAGPPVGNLLEGSELAPLFIKSGFLQPFYSPELVKTPPQYRDENQAHRRDAVFLLWHRLQHQAGSARHPAQEFRGICSIPNGRTGSPGAWVRIPARHMFVANLMLTMGEANCDSYLRKLASQNVVGFPGAPKP